MRFRRERPSTRLKVPLIILQALHVGWGNLSHEDRPWMMVQQAKFLL